MSDSLLELPVQPLHRGGRFAHRLEVTGARLTVVWTATRVRQLDLVEWTGEGPAGSRAVVRIGLSSAGRGRTRVSYTCELNTPSGPLGLVAERAFGGDRAERQARAGFERMREHLEDRAAP